MGNRRDTGDAKDAAGNSDEVSETDDDVSETDDEVREMDEVAELDELVEVGEGGEETGAAWEEELEQLRGELAETRDRHLRLAAEFDNFRRRSHAQMGESTTRAQAALVGKLVDVLDDFERISSFDPGQAAADSVLEGVALVERKLHRVLEDAGLEPVEPEGEPFDPNEMEAMMREPTSSAEEDETVSRVLQKGFRFRGHLVRPARVSVLKYEHEGGA